MIFEAKMTHKLWNILEYEGYKVAGEVKVVSDDIYDRIWQSKPILEKIKLYVDDLGNIRFKIKKGVPTTIDLVATDGWKFIGFEVKDEFRAIVYCIVYLRVNLNITLRVVCLMNYT